VLEQGRTLGEILGEKTAKSFARQLGYTHAGELLEHFPRRYAKRGELTDIAALPVGELATVVGEITKTNHRYTKGRGGSIYEVTISDGSASMQIAFFGQSWRQNQLVPGKRGLFSGKVGLFSGKLQLAHPDYELFEDDKDAQAWADLPLPIYPATGSLPSWRIAKAIVAVLAGERLKDPLAEFFPETDLSSLLEKIHVPKRDADFVEAREQLKRREALTLQLGLVLRRQALQSQASYAIDSTDLAMQFDKRLPFEYTPGQLAAISEIEKDLGSGHPMHRLLQGEVGSGKTVIALRAILMAASSGHQSALLAPTEVLAEQHYQSTISALGPELTRELGVRLLTGSRGSAERKRALLDMASGKCLLAIGTHALIAEKVSFAQLGLVVIDEQHRFGVGQRELLRLKAKMPPHVLTMTATPIPRTIAITAFGDLDISTLRELPKGRQEVKTHVVDIANKGLVSRVWERVKEEVSQGRQAFVVCPRIEAGKDEGDILEGDTPAAAAEEVFESLKKNAALAGLSIALLHGRMDSESKADVMHRFASGETSVLVSTTVIEVGVNVPNASAMVILDADRFGISQLHQLRGRVGRGSHPGVCLLISASESGSLARKRLEALEQTSDGFKLSEMDLEIRGEGDVLGQDQSGRRSQLRLLRVTKDIDIIVKARALAEGAVEEGLSEPVKSFLERLDAEALAQS
jgi:ATP-dependent DNA helicase RecG